ncbi:LuxR family transcriptional regulator [Dactylosporangium sucinum]|uniref:LuxR family transcriptional regulator n=1 Tax=Dactylosporangium sucinum TaxID=1424081 RepID=A0A917TSU0_9ACTN|nr:LuxR family transcriptional regulator [Dactylosporangium sucinum]
MTAVEGVGVASALPVETTTFIGRGPEEDAICALLGSSRLVTLTGVGGVGKTRLALRVSKRLQPRFPDGVFLVDLSTVRESDLVAPTLAMTLGIGDESAQTPLARLISHVDSRHMLLVLDNCEHVLESCLRLVDALLRASAGLHVLATSRQSLGVAGEQSFVVTPLSFPGPDGEVSAEDCAEYDAIRLFVERAAASVAGFRLTTANARQAAALCAQLDGLPLAIELAAVRMRALSVDQILARLDERYRLLTGGNRAAHPRQHTLRALVDWSFELCSPEERLLWARLGVFVGSFDLDAAEHVCADPALPRGTILDLVTALVDKSIITREEHGAGSIRYRLLETIREYGLLQPTGWPDGADARRRHRDYYLLLAERGETEWLSSREAQWNDHARREQPNFRAALEFCLAVPGEAEAGLAMAGALWLHWRTVGLLTEGRRWFDRLLAVADQPTPTRAKALWANAWLATLQGDQESAEPLLAECEELARLLDDEAVLDQAREIHGLASLFRGDNADAVRLLEGALAGHRRRADHVARLITLHRLAQAALAAGDTERARDLATQCISLSGPEASWIARQAKWILGIARWRLGDVAAAVELEREVVQGSWAHQDRVGMAVGTQVLAWIAGASGHAVRAARLLGATDRICREVGALFTARAHLVGFQTECEERVRAALPPGRFAASFAAGVALSDADVIAEVMDETSPARTRAVSDVTLTPREQQIAELVAEGLTNPEIAKVLLISARTAETHVQHILAKIGGRSRAQIAVWVVEHGLRAGA